MSEYPAITPFEDPKENTAIRQSPYSPQPDIEGYIGLDGFADELTVLSNPHKGWYWHYIDNGFIRSEYRGRHSNRDTLLDFPGLNHLYLRFDWGDIEKQEGVLDWSYIDSIMERWGALGYRFSLRVCTYEGDPNARFATPEFVYKAGAKGYSLSGGRLEPDYGDPIFLDKLSAFMAKVGEKFNGDPRIEMIDVGTFGTWGEGHTANGTMKIYPSWVLKKHIDMTVDNFPDTHVLFNDDIVNSRWPGGIEDNLELLNYAVSKKLGLDEDGVCVSCYSDKTTYNTLRTPWMFDMFWKNGPIVLEFEHYDMVRKAVFKDGFPFLDAMMRTHATFAGFHGYPRPWLEREPWFTQYCANRLGYWYFINGISTTGLTADGDNEIKLYFENRGFGKCYEKYAVKAELRGADGSRSEFCVECDNRDWLPGSTVVSAKSRLAGMAAGEYGLYLGMFEGERPIELAFNKSRCENGMYHLCDLEVK